MTRLHPDLLALKAVTRALSDACGGSEASSVVLDGKSPSLIRSYGNQNAPDRFMPLDDVIVLERCAGRPIVSAWMADRARADPDRPRRAPSPADIPRVAKELGDVLHAKAGAWQDGKLCAADKRAVAKELREAIAALSEMLDDMEGGE